jgi:hypothetical protein
MKRPKSEDYQWGVQFKKAKEEYTGHLEQANKDLQLNLIAVRDQNKELIEEIKLLKLDEEFELPNIEMPPIKYTRYKMSKIFEGSDHSGENMTDKTNKK